MMAKAVLHGIAVSTGIAIGKGFFLNRAPGLVRHDLVSLEMVESEIARLQSAIASVVEDFALAKEHLPRSAAANAEVIETHLLICQDPKLGGEAQNRIREQRMNAEWALEEAVARVADIFSQINSPYIRDRIEDVRLVADRILLRLAGNAPLSSAADERGILLAHDLAPADAIGLTPERVFSFAVERGGKTSHTGIVARSLNIPAVVGVSGLGETVADGDLVIVDGLKGRLLVDPDEDELAHYLTLQSQFNAYETRIRTHASRPAETEDGQRVAVFANIDITADTVNMTNFDGEGIGLVRTEFLYITRTSLPTEEELFACYDALARTLAPRPVTFRTLDVGGEKLFMGRKNLDEPNPALGLRAIRYCIRHQDIFRTQLRAILRASARGNVAIMFPLISGVSELRLVKSILNEARQELDAAKAPYDTAMPVGIMIELPSAVFSADVLAREVDFFSIGTNDLIQYALGIDRENRHVAHMHLPLHPAIVRAIKQVVDMAHRAGISVSICGEMAADPYCLPILLGMPIDSLSLAPQSIPAIKHLIRRSNAQHCAELLSQALEVSTVTTINAMARQSVYTLFPDDVSFFISQMDANT